MSGAIAGTRRYQVVIDRIPPLWFYVQVVPTTDPATFESLVALIDSLADTVAFS